MSHRIHVHQTGMQDTHWDFEANAPKWRPMVDGHPCHAAGTTLDPFPGYPHDSEELHKAVRRVTACFQPHWDVHLFSSDREHVGRTNAFSTYSQSWDPDARDLRPVDYGAIFLAGKRIPPHPAMTRHLVAHEYGHQVEWMLEVATGQGLGKRDLVAEYVAMRGLDTSHHGDGGNWHNAPSEVFACDFRIAVCGYEPEYWPHPGVPHPFEVPAVADWWMDTSRKFA